MRDRTRWARLRTTWAANWRIFAEGRIGLVGVTLLVAVGLLALLHPLLLATVWDREIYDPITGFTKGTSFPSAPSWTHPLGVSRFGRDVLSQLMYSVRVAFGLGIMAAAISVSFGTLVGCIAAFYRGRAIDTLFMRLANFLMIFPTFTLLDQASRPAQQKSFSCMAQMANPMCCRSSSSRHRIRPNWIRSIRRK